jgi:hypothetical protein
MDQEATREQKVTDLVAHKTPQELALALIEQQEAYDALMFDSKRIADMNKASAAAPPPATPVEPDPEDVPPDEADWM